ncbi:hypothetical protein LCGC14_0370400 [marine sediment metagenome]|uniref:Uncharacterized protein n=1 Tax=marine sediment metagenome TaxID=412755 RepID=A0A0F9TB22_9ZZZZ|nr:hypothetical protein [Maribacter sp.]HDZ04879.1 hypothetical protein [Maribacter sp.]
MTEEVIAELEKSGMVYHERYYPFDEDGQPDNETAYPLWIAIAEKRDYLLEHQGEENLEL